MSWNLLPQLVLFASTIGLFQCAGTGFDGGPIGLVQVDGGGDARGGNRSADGAVKFTSYMTEPDASLSGDSPEYGNAAELCAYVNVARNRDKEHPRSAGAGSLGVPQTWDIQFTVDPALSEEARYQVNLLRQAGEKAAPPGDLKGDGVRYRKLWVDGLGQENTAYQVTTREEAGDWNVAYYKGGLDNSNGTARIYLYYHDPGTGSGIRRMRIGCAGANASEDPSAIWWTVLVRP